MFLNLQFTIAEEVRSAITEQRRTDASNPNSFITAVYSGVCRCIRRLLPLENYFNNVMTAHCSSPENEILARIQQLSGSDLLNAPTRAAA